MEYMILHLIRGLNSIESKSSYIRRIALDKTKWFFSMVPKK